MDEFELIRRYFTRDARNQDVRLGIGDDAAVLAPPVGTEIIAAVDTLVAGVHFPRDLNAKDVGYRAVAVNLSDIAAMGGSPRWMTLALTLVSADPEWLAAFAGGLFEAGDRYGVSLVGGDTTRGRETVVSVQMIASIAPGAALTRHGAEPGDMIFVTGTPGDAAAGLQLIAEYPAEDPASGYLRRRFLRPEPRVAIGELITHFASAAIDISDGLFADLDKLVTSSGVAAVIDLSKLPLSNELTTAFDHAAAVSFALSGGDDYELCFTAPAEAEQPILELAQATGERLTLIGHVSEGDGLQCTKNGRPVDFQHAGYRHFDDAEKP